MRRLRLVVVVLLGLTACSETPTSPAPARWSSAEPGLACPAPIVVPGVIGASAPVTYTQPAAAGDTAVADVACLPASGAAFPLGSTTVACQATDRLGRRASCAFAVTLTPAVFGIKKIVAFGDSVTRGENGIPAGGVVLLVVDTPNAYPTKLLERFSEDFPGQGITVAISGVSGERIADGVARLPGVLMAQQPQALLLLEGYNDLFALGLPGASQVAEGLRAMVRIARTAGVAHVFVSTLTPSGPGRNQISQAVILQTNVLIRQMAAAEGAVLVASDDAFFGQAATLIGPDGLHPTPAGNLVLATTFYDALRTRVPVTTALR